MRYIDKGRPWLGSRGVAASMLLSGSALAAATMPATMASAAGNVITLSAPAQMTTRLGCPAPLAISATETDPTQTLTFSATGVPALPVVSGRSR